MLLNKKKILLIAVHIFWALGDIITLLHNLEQIHGRVMIKTFSGILHASYCVSELYGD